MTREEAKEMMRKDVDAYGRPKKLMTKINMIYDDFEKQLQALNKAAVIKSLPDSDEIRMKARELDEKDFDQWWWETVYKGNVL